MKLLVLASLSWSIAAHADARDIVGTCENAADGEPVVELKDPRPPSFAVNSCLLKKCPDFLWMRI